MQPSTLSSTVPNGAPAGSATMSTGCGRGAMQLAQRKPQHVALVADRWNAARRGAPSAGAIARKRLAEPERIVGLDRRDAIRAEAEAGRIGSASAMVLCRPAMSWRGFARVQEAHAPTAP